MKKLLLITLITAVGIGGVGSLQAAYAKKSTGLSKPTTQTSYPLNISRPPIAQRANPIQIQMNRLDKAFEDLSNKKKSLKGYQLVQIRKIKDTMLVNRKKFKALQKQLKQQQKRK